MTSKPKMIGSINCRVASMVSVGLKRGNFDGTLKGLAIKAQKMGAKAGDLIHADFGGDGSDLQAYMLVSVPGDTRANGVWPRRYFAQQQVESLRGYLSQFANDYFGK